MTTVSKEGCFHFADRDIKHQIGLTNWKSSMCARTVATGSKTKTRQNDTKILSMCAAIRGLAQPCPATIGHSTSQHPGPWKPIRAATAARSFCGLELALQDMAAR